MDYQRLISKIKFLVFSFRRLEEKDSKLKRLTHSLKAKEDQVQENEVK